jgi:NDP-sugar pyrophosphorylase family protein
MAGGKGTRLHPFSANFPKPLMPLGDMPILELLLRRLSNAGVTEVFMAVNHLAHLIQAFFGDGEKFGMKIRYTHEDQPLGTAGALGAIIDQLDDDFLLTNGDLLTTLDIEAMISAHRSWNADATIGVYEREVKIDFGVIEVDDDYRMKQYREKPSSSCLVSMGIYVLRREGVRQHIAMGKYLDMPTLVENVRDSSGDVRCFHDDCFWLDIGRPEDFSRAQEMFAENREMFLGSPAARPTASARPPLRRVQPAVRKRMDAGREILKTAGG